jgi:hypothetical protein
LVGLVVVFLLVLGLVRDYLPYRPGHKHQLMYANVTV